MPRKDPRGSTLSSDHRFDRRAPETPGRFRGPERQGVNEVTATSPITIVTNWIATIGRLAGGNSYPVIDHIVLPASREARLEEIEQMPRMMAGLSRSVASDYFLGVG